MGLNKRLIGAGATAGAGGLTPSENFKAVTYTGTGSSQSITGVGFQPDFVWIKQRGGTTWHNLQDSTRGSTKHLYSNATNSEDTTADGVTSFDSDGFTLGGGNGFNGSGQSMVAWCWKAGGGTTSSNTDGTITSTVQANTDAGFSIATYTGSGSTATIGHGLSAAPEMIIAKSTSDAYEWKIWHKDLSSGYQILFNTAAQASDSSVWTTTTPTSTVFSIGTNVGVNGGSKNYVAYAFKSIDGFSKFGSYTGNGSTDGPLVETGFEPAFVMIKNTENGGTSWVMADNKRGFADLYANASDAEFSSGDLYGAHFLSNGFTLNTTDISRNANNIKYIYMAFAADPDTEAPTLASSFNIETYTGNGSSQSITGLGFSPNLVWLKSRSSTYWHSLVDSVRGAAKPIFSNSTSAETTDNIVGEFLSDGFTTGTDATGSNNGSTYVAWTWKADDNEPTIFGGPAIAVYKFEDNANDVTGNYNATTATNITYSSSGKFNKAGVFNGSSTKVEFDGIGSLPTGTQKVSWSMWVHTDTGSQSCGLGGYGRWNIGGTNAGAAQHYFGTGLSSGNLYFYGYYYNDGVSVALPTGQWNHLVYTFDGTNVKIYLNGSLKGTINRSSLDIGGGSGNLDLTIGKQAWNDSAEIFDGMIDQVRIYRGALDEYQVNELYNETASQNDDLELGGPPKSIVSANANAGFSIVKYEGTGADMKVPHGLSAAPDMLIVKGLETTNDWSVLHKDGSNGDFLQLNSSAAESGAGSIFGSTFTRPTATVFTVGNTGETGTADKQYIAYCWHSVTGYSKFGTYTGNGGTQTISGLGFQPDFCINKSTSASSDWNVTDSLRGNQQALNPNTSAVEGNQSPNGLTFTSDGFTVTDNSGGGSSVNGNGITYIYWAVAKNVPSNTTLANSFKAIAYTGNGGTQSITGTGFKPDLVWIKHRNEANDHVLTDSIRGRGLLYANGIDAQNQDSQLTSFDSDGFSLAYNTGQNVKFNKSGGTYVAWAWKAGNTWQSNLDGTIPSTINVNTANGFSIVKWTGNATNSTVGHGLSSTPEFIIMKNTSAAGAWLTWHKDYGGGDKYMYLNSTNAVATQSQFFNSTIPTSTVFSLGIHGDINGNGNDIIAYCFHSVAGYSKIGSYTGNGSANNAITGVGFQPNWLMIKNTTDAGNDWQIYDSARTEGYVLLANSSNAEADNSSNFGQFDSDGFTVQSNNDGNNKSGSTYIYMAIKMN